MTTEELKAAACEQISVTLTRAEWCTVNVAASGFIRRKLGKEGILALMEGVRAKKPKGDEDAFFIMLGYAMSVIVGKARADELERHICEFSMQGDEK